MTDNVVVSEVDARMNVLSMTEKRVPYGELDGRVQLKCDGTR